MSQATEDHTRFDSSTFSNAQELAAVRRTYGGLLDAIAQHHLKSGVVTPCEQRALAAAFLAGRKLAAITTEQPKPAIITKGGVFRSTSVERVA